MKNIINAALAAVVMLTVAVSGVSAQKYANKKPGATPVVTAPAPVAPAVGTTPAPVAAKTTPGIVPTVYSAEDSAGIIRLVKSYLKAAARKSPKFKETDFKSFSFTNGEFVSAAALYISAKPINPGKGADWFAREFEKNVNSELNSFLPAVGGLLKNWNVENASSGKKLQLVVVVACDEGESGFGQKNLTAITQRTIYGKEQIGKILTYSMNVETFDVIPVSIPGKQELGKFIGIFLIDPLKAPAGDYGLNDVLYQAMGQFNAECNLKISLPLPTQQVLVEVPATPAPAVTTTVPVVAPQTPVIEIGGQKIRGKKPLWERFFGSSFYSPFSNFREFSEVALKTTLTIMPVYTGTNGTEVALKEMGLFSSQVSLWDDDETMLATGPAIGRTNVSLVLGWNLSTALRLDENSYVEVKGLVAKLGNEEKTFHAHVRGALIVKGFELSGFYQDVKAGQEFKFNQDNVVAGSYDVGDYKGESFGFGAGYYLPIKSQYLFFGLDYFSSLKTEHIKNKISTPDKSSGRWGIHAQLIF